MKTITHVQVLEREYNKRKGLFDGSYSLRAFARDLDVEPAVLSLVMKNKRNLPRKQAVMIAKSLSLKGKEYTLFIESANNTRVLEKLDTPDQDQRLMIEEDDVNYQILSEWEYFVVLSLLDIVDLKVTEAVVSKKLGVTLVRAEEVVTNLLRAELVSWKEGHLVKNQTSVRTTEDVSSKALQAGHLEVLELGKKKLFETNIESRDFSDLTMAISPKMIPEVKVAIREFRQKLMSLAERADKTEVYKVAFQLYPMTEIEV